MADKCFRCKPINISDDICKSDTRCHDDKSFCPTSRGSTRRIVGGEEETFTGPKTASELLKQYLNHCGIFSEQKFGHVHSSIVQNFQYELLKELHGKELADHHSGKFVSEETPSEEEGMKDFKKSSTDNEKKEGLAKAAHRLKYIEIENEKHNLQRAVTMPIQRRTFAAWSPDLEPVQEIRSSADNI
ncbi:hypothetical protein SUGI_0014850 [Cryptomeria japonica]|nr:hypothetical protein SUGI_0014850 [Cryptomeria japonica]